MQADPRHAAYSSYGNGLSYGYGHSSMDSMLQGFSSMNMHNGPANPIGKGNTYYQFPDGSVMMAGANAYQPYYNVQSSLPSTQMNARSNWQPQQFSDASGIPGLRRSSWSSNEEVGPSTPQFGQNYQPNVPVVNLSPDPWSTPSPEQLSQYYKGREIFKVREGGDEAGYAQTNYLAVTQAEPAIPFAIPAIFTENSGRGSLQKILENAGETENVYIRGLHPDTTDDMLYGYGIRFGDIQSCKAIIEHPTGRCKGFGFIKYHNLIDSENCIRAFHYLGYEAKYAKQSHNARLKTLSDPSNTNLYVSNIPKWMNKEDLAAIFTNDDATLLIKSSKVLLDSEGCSRSVGFVRFEDRETCDRVISHFHGKPMGEGENALPLQLRFADSDDQKRLKAETVKHRLFKTNEYNCVAYGDPASPWYRSTIAQALPSPGPVRTQMPSGSWLKGTSMSSSSSTKFGQATAGAQQRDFSSLKSRAENFGPVRQNGLASYVDSPSVDALKRQAGNVAAYSLPKAPGVGNSTGPRPNIGQLYADDGVKATEEIITPTFQATTIKDESSLFSPSKPRL